MHWPTGATQPVPKAQAHPLTPIPIPIPIPSTEDASTLIYRKGESRCILIASGLGPRAHMYAHLKPCDSKQASGLLTVAAAAVRNAH